VLDVEGAHGEKLTVSLTSQLSVKHDLLVHYRSSSAKAKDKFTMYLQQLVVQVWQDQAISNAASNINITDDEYQKLQQVTESIGLYFNTKAQKVEQFSVTTIPDAKTKLINLIKIFFKGQQHALLLNGELADKVFTKKRGQLTEMTQDRFEEMWLGDMSTRGLSDDDYLSYFWPDCPQYEHHEADIVLIYQDLYQVIVKAAAKKASKSMAKPSKGAK